MPVPRGKSGLSESASLVQSTDVMSYTEEAGSMLPTSSQEDCPPDAEEDFIDSDVSVLAQFHEDAIRQVREFYIHSQLRNDKLFLCILRFLVKIFIFNIFTIYLK